MKRRGALENDSLIPDMGKVLRARKGSKVSRFFKHIFEHKKIKRILGANMALVIIATSFVPVNVSGNDYEENIITEENTPLSTEQGARFPVENVRITQGYRFFHPGVDFDGVTGDKIHPAMAGKVEAVEYSRFAYGNAVLVSHGGGMTTLYAHLSKIYVKKGDELAKNDIVGEMGATGRSWGDHLHFEVRDHGFPISPYNILPRS